jgi:hypothetical protein
MFPTELWRGAIIDYFDTPLKKKVIRTETIRSINPSYDSSRDYLPRTARNEWNIIGIIGTLKVIKGAPVNKDWVHICTEDLYEIYLVR